MWENLGIQKVHIELWTYTLMEGTLKSLHV